MDQMANEHNFCISSAKEKMPLYVGDFLKTKNPNDIVPVDRNNIKHLPTLNEINNCFNFDNMMRAYHAHAADNLIVGFDVENFEGSEFDKVGFKAPHRTDPEYLAWFASLPAHYREYSAHYGIHLFYQLRRTKLTPQSLDMLTNRTEYKVKTVVNGKKLEFELMMNNHWLSITRHTFGKFIPVSQDVPDDIYKLINNEANRWTKSQHDAIVLDITQKASPLAQKIADLYSPTKYDELKNNTVDDFNDDDSYYEYNIALKIAGSLNYRLQHPRPFDAKHLECDPKTVSDNDLVWAVSSILQTAVPSRNKDNEKRDGLPWLVYVAKKAVAWVKSTDSTKHQQNKQAWNTLPSDEQNVIKAAENTSKATSETKQAEQKLNNAFKNLKNFDDGLNDLDNDS